MKYSADIVFNHIFVWGERKKYGNLGSMAEHVGLNSFPAWDALKLAPRSRAFFTRFYPYKASAPAGMYPKGF